MLGGGGMVGRTNMDVIQARNGAGSSLLKGRCGAIFCRRFGGRCCTERGDEKVQILN